MANEQDSQVEWQRLYELYHGMSDEELLELGGQLQDLTEIAADVLSRELKARRLAVEPVVEQPEPIAFVVESDLSLAPGKVVLYTFHDAIQAGLALRHLEDALVEFEVRDHSELPSVGFYSGSGVDLRVIVEAADRAQAMAVLRKTMGLFPLQEVSEADEMVDDGSRATLGEFAERAEADEFVGLLGDAGIWCQLVDRSADAEAGENTFEIEVRETDLDRAIAVVEAGMELDDRVEE